jgi:predicted nucleotidyltransferase
MFGLSKQNIKIITNILGDYKNIEKAVIYGSRAMGNYKNGSDIDLTLFGDSLTLDDLAKIAGDCEDSKLPYMVDLSLFKQIENQDLKEHIEKYGKVFINVNLIK